MTLKLLFARGRPDPRRQAVGGAGVDKRIDVLAVAIQAGLTVFDLEEAELAYAPQYGSAKDPIDMAGFVASGLLRGEHPRPTSRRSSPHDRTSGPCFWTSARPSSTLAGISPGASMSRWTSCESRLMDLPRDREIAAYCQVGQRGYLATRILLQAGLRARNVGGGYKTYRLFFPKAKGLEN